jgi:hypothetical protein
MAGLYLTDTGTAPRLRYTDSDLPAPSPSTVITEGLEPGAGVLQVQYTDSHTVSPPSTYPELVVKVIKKDDEPLLNLTGARAAAKERRYFCVYKERTIIVPSLNTGGLSVHSMNKT